MSSSARNSPWEEIVDTQRYRGDGTSIAALAHQCSTAYSVNGVAILEGFLTEEAVEASVSEAEFLQQFGHYSEVFGTPYLSPVDETLPQGHPGRTLSRSALTAIPYDRIPGDSLLRILYESPVFREFVRAVVNAPELFAYADPLGAMNLASMHDGDELAWHFDQTDFVVSIALQSSERGGEFEVVPGLRTSPLEQTQQQLVATQDVLQGDRSDVTCLPMTPGTLMIFRGRDSLHRVAPISGAVTRHVALLAYDTTPGTDSSDHLKWVRYGRIPAGQSTESGVNTHG